MLKEGLTVLAALACAGLGITLSLRLSARARRLAAWRAALTRLAGALRYAAFPLPAALRYAARPDAPALEALREAMERAPARGVAELWAEIPREDALRPEDRRAIDLGVRALESATVEQQCAGLALSMAALERLEEQAEKKTEKSARLYLSGGCLGGALLLIILL